MSHPEWRWNTQIWRCYLMTVVMITTLKMKCWGITYCTRWNPTIQSTGWWLERWFSVTFQWSICDHSVDCMAGTFQLLFIGISVAFQWSYCNYLVAFQSPFCDHSVTFQSPFRPPFSDFLATIQWLLRDHSVTCLSPWSDFSVTI